MRGVFLIAVLTVLCHGHVLRQDEIELEWWESTIFYQIYPRSFADSDGDGIDIKIVLDLVPNHTSNESIWFQEALKGNEKYYNYFVWEDGIIDENGEMQPPNNWNVIRFWLDKGVAGFRVDAVNCLFEVDKDMFGGKYPDEPFSGRTDVDPESHDYLSHIYTKDQNETYYMVYQWRNVFDEIAAKDGLPRVMMTEVYASIQDVVKYFGEGDQIGAQVPFNFDLITDVDASSSAADMKRAIDKFLTYKPLDKKPNWVGEEIGLVDGYVSWEDTVDPSGCNTNDPINYVTSSRDPERTPFQWNAEKNAGFSTADKTWLPVAEGYETLNVEVQKAAERSNLKVYQALADLRQDSVFRYGRYDSLAINHDVFAFRRDVFDASAVPVAPYEGIVLKALAFLLPFLFLTIHATQRELEWWETTIFYQIYPRSFMDSDGDGIGDLKGITSKLEYLKELGVGATWLSPMFQSPMYDFGYDISDFYAVHDEYGTMEDFEEMLAKAKELDIKIVLDFVPNHSSNESVWFDEALRGHEKYFDYFVWEDPVEDENGILHPPNNWNSVFRKSAWEYREEVGKYYLHQFVIGQPDLNYRNPEVVEEMKNVIRFWLDKGVAGFRVDAIAHLFEVDKELYNGKYPDEPISGQALDDPESYDYLNHIYTKDQEETFDMVYQWREVFDEFKEKDGLSRVMMTEAYSSPIVTMKYFGNEKSEGAQMPFNFVLISDVNGDSTAGEIKYALDKFLAFKPIDKLANWVAGNHDNSRVASRFSPKLVDGVNMIVLLLPGIAVTYMGEEIGMVDGYISWEDTVDPSGCNTDDPINYWMSSRDPERTPFQWSGEKNAGFTTGDKTWLPLADGYETLNVAVQSSIEKSHLNIYKTLAKLRTESTFRYGRYESVAFNSDVFAFRRWHEGEVYIVVVNFREQAHQIDLTYFENVVGHLEVIVTSVQSPKNGYSGGKLREYGGE
ncbi:unnamed protein product [Leptidea sinapis]|uniref:alpha-glucosidase n=1 Tax=Leptidea sinapis TaxID=189913 RepID=A0A5E4R6V8_9NEOP|nr:unnamed protein product [Leptidea sinapis]